MALSDVDILVFAAHADDIELSCGATVVHCVRQGKRVGLVDLTRGEMATRGTPETRLRESDAARRELGADFREQLDLGDGGLRTGREEELELIRIIRACRPSLVIGPWPDERHPDHSRTGELVTSAWFYAGLRKLDTGQEAHRPSAVVYYLQNYVPHPTFVVNVTADWEQKMKAVRAYESQFFDPQSTEPATFISKPSFLDMIDARGRHFGALIGAEFGEAFMTKQPPAIDDLLSAYRGREV